MHLWYCRVSALGRGLFGVLFLLLCGSFSAASVSETDSTEAMHLHGGVVVFSADADFNRSISASAVEGKRFKLQQLHTGLRVTAATPVSKQVNSLTSWAARAKARRSTPRRHPQEPLYSSVFFTDAGRAASSLRYHSADPQNAFVFPGASQGFQAIAAPGFGRPVFHFSEILSRMRNPHPHTLSPNPLNTGFFLRPPPFSFC